MKAMSGRNYFIARPSCKIKFYSVKFMSVLVSTCSDFDFNTVALVWLQV